MAWQDLKDITSSAGLVLLNSRLRAMWNAIMGGLTSKHIQDEAVTTTKIKDQAITNQKLAHLSVDTANIMLGAIKTAHIGDAQINELKVANGAITRLKVGTGAIGTAQIGNAVITDAHIGSLNASKITAGTLNAAIVTVSNLNADNITVGSINGQRIAPGTIANGHIGAGQVAPEKLNIPRHVIFNATLTNNSPSAGYVAWSGLKITYAGVTYNITNGNSNKKFLCWYLANPTVLTGVDAIPTNFTVNDCVALLNDSGKALSPSNMTLLPGDLVIPGTITSEKISTGAITSEKIFTGAVKAASIDTSDLVASDAFISTLTTAVLNVSTVKAVDGSVDFLLSKDALAAYIRFSDTTGITVGRIGGRFQNVVGDTGFVVYRDSLATTTLNDMGMNADYIRANKQFIVNAGVSIEYTAEEGLAMRLL